MFSVSTLGELLIDFTDAGTSAGGQRLFERNAGGAPANVLVALERLGHRTAFLGKVGRDMHGEFLRATLEEQGVDVTGLVLDPDAFTTLAFVALSPDGEREFSFARKPGADTRITPDELARDVISSSHVFHVGSLSLTDEPARSATLEALRVAREAGCVTSYDPNYRANLWPSVEAAVEQMRAVVPQMDLMKLSDEECALLTGLDDPEAAAAALLGLGPKVVAVTLGGAGAYVRCADGGATVPGFAADAVDATGAGDSFWGGFLAGFCESGKRPEEVGVEDAAGFARLGNAVASLCVRKRGAIPAMPARADVEALLAE
ncbi:PfkB family carbohydrate kinase [Olsenella sp. An290]|uniref:PfkB family carbohydrate kinase n=1 Tax=Olsenella sp. An290 TaxID=1965625 RepID=UPI000B398FBB|nr:PfkB family carbohydrate kinase [Olsenella sp. An290]OUO33255.1 carbohydrate kinase [Olsenella sp. An290]